VLQIAHADPQGYQNYSNYFSPSTFPMAGVGKYELRDTYVVDIQRVNSLQRGYCYSHRIVFLDKETFELIDVDLYDATTVSGRESSISIIPLRCRALRAIL
jgi:hypothetical protein